MADSFDRFLGRALAPEERAPDRRFVALVQARIALDERLAAQRRELVGSLLRQLAALVSVAAATWWLGRAALVAEWFGRSPATGLVALLAGFGLIVALFSGAAAGRPAWAARGAVSRH